MCLIWHKKNLLYYKNGASNTEKGCRWNCIYAYPIFWKTRVPISEKPLCPKSYEKANHSIPSKNGLSPASAGLFAVLNLDCCNTLNETLTAFTDRKKAFSYSLFRSMRWILNFALSGKTPTNAKTIFFRFRTHYCTGSGLSNYAFCACEFVCIELWAMSCELRVGHRTNQKIKQHYTIKALHRRSAFIV